VREQLIGSGCNVQLVEGTGGVFDIVVDNQLKFSKKINGNFPSEKEISSIISGF
jgi:predicted Rdx family selenoprotein